MLAKVLPKIQNTGMISTIIITFQNLYLKYGQIRTYLRLEDRSLRFHHNSPEVLASGLGSRGEEKAPN